MTTYPVERERPMLNATDPEVTRFLTAWHENGRASFEKDYTSLVYDTYKHKAAKDRKRFVALDVQTLDQAGAVVSASGCMLVDRDTREVFSISGYGRPNRKIGTLEGLTRAYEVANAAGRELPGPGYVGNDGALAKLSAMATETNKEEAPNASR